MHFIIIYSKEAHAIDTGKPGSNTYDEAGNPIYEPQTYKERLELARKTVAAEGITVPVLVDEMNNAVWLTYGPAPNNAYLIGTNGEIVEKQGWYQPQEMGVAIDQTSFLCFILVASNGHNSSECWITNYLKVKLRL